MKDFYTSIETSKQLKEWGCDLDSKNVFVFCDTGNWIIRENDDDFLKTKPAYHLLEDICVKYAKEFFGEKLNTNKNKNPEQLTNDYLHPEILLGIIKMHSKQEAEEYLLSNTIFNPKNK